jgi:hypothetical protein
LPVALDSSFIADGGIIGIKSGSATCTTLPQKVQALIEQHSDLT